MQIHIHHHPDDELNEKLGCLIAILEDVMADLSKLQADVAAQTTIIESNNTLLSGLAQEIRDLKNVGSADQAMQAAIDDLASKVEANTKSLSDAVVANTPASTDPGAPTVAPPTPTP